MIPRYKILIFFLVVLSFSVAQVQAGPHEDAVDYSSKVSKALNSLTLPYDRTLTMSNLEQLGYDVDNMSRPGTYRIYIKKASFNSNTGLLTLNINI